LAIKNIINIFVKKKTIMETQVTNLNQVKKGEKVWRLMERHNPQLGTYYVFEEHFVNRVNKKSLSLDDGFLYDKESGYRKLDSQSVYGSSFYSVMTENEAKTKFLELQSNGQKVRGFNQQ
jgi:hypothetical protein